MASPSDVLRVDPDADDEAIERAYRRRVKEVHPDQGGSAREFRRVVAAYEALSGDGEAEAGDEEPADVEPSAPAGTRVEYLNDAVLGDHGWELDDHALFEKAADADLDTHDCGRFTVDTEGSLLEAAERCGFEWPYACRGGACANCAVAVTEGELSMPVDHILPREMVEEGIRLSCVGTPTTDELQVVFNIKHRAALEDLRLPADRFERSRGGG